MLAEDQKGRPMILSIKNSLFLACEVDESRGFLPLKAIIGNFMNFSMNAMRDGSSVSKSIYQYLFGEMNGYFYFYINILFIIFYSIF